MKKGDLGGFETLQPEGIYGKRYKFSRNELIPGFLTMCRVEKDKGELTIIGGSGADEPGSGAED